MLKSPQQLSPEREHSTDDTSSESGDDEGTNTGSTTNGNGDYESDASSVRDDDLFGGPDTDEEGTGTRQPGTARRQRSVVGEGSDENSGSDDGISDGATSEADGTETPIDEVDDGEVSDDGESSTGALHILGRSQSHRRQPYSPPKPLGQIIDGRLSLHRGPSQNASREEQFEDLALGDSRDAELFLSSDDSVAEQEDDEDGSDAGGDAEGGSTVEGFGSDSADDLEQDVDMGSVEPEDENDSDAHKSGAVGDEDLSGPGKIEVAGDINLVGEIPLGEEFEGKRKRALQLMTDIELVFAKLREKIYKEKMQAIEAEEIKVRDGSHPEITQRLRDMEVRKDYQLSRLAAWKERSILYVEGTWKDRRRRAHGHYKSLRRDLRDRLAEEAVSKRWKAAEEGRRMDEVLSGVSHDSPDRSVLAKRRKLHRAEASELSRIQRDRQGFPASLISGLSKTEMTEDLDKLGIAKLPVGTKPSKSSKLSPTHPTTVSPAIQPSSLHPSSSSHVTPGGVSSAQSGGMTYPSIPAQRPPAPPVLPGPPPPSQVSQSQQPVNLSSYPAGSIGLGMHPQQPGMHEQHRAPQYSGGPAVSSGSTGGIRGEGSLELDPRVST
ncbi:hypothetical protein M427DRAFT_37896 [Gonapodya prolifera JEL478]|uniref:Uncharacterized protein n=1 Tax=Gonapodya prolifera (strain JEL478) TaxID=1344416 RepID=A0A139A0C8_GONPJ|nr:hypothetical protein M427DRAFT_37896 [Gonapodya prolifera JEL478]|eukprot:KXS10088.1 hypothetical protein M427DRAFT_37896 [Gonapodya prolifera JEL478]